MTPDQAQFLAQQYAQLMHGEFAATRKVLAAVKDDTRDYRPDDKSRTAWELATHLATADVWFLDSIITGQFVWDPEKVKQVEGQFTSVAEIVAFYEKTFPEKLKAIAAMTPADLAKTISFFGMMEMPAASFLGMANNHGIHHRGQLAGLPAGDGLEGAGDLRRQRRRADEGLAGRAAASGLRRARLPRLVDRRVGMVLVPVEPVVRQVRHARELLARERP